MHTDIFRIPTKIERADARELFKISENDFHIVYAGRLIANKGLTQLIRTLNLWPQNNIRLSIVGNFELDFVIYQSNSNHSTFPNYFKREISNRNTNFELVCLPAMNHKELNKLFWSTDCFVYPSFHEDEALGTTPREAILSGVPVIVSDFCGLGQLRNIQSGLLKTYSSLGGVRYSLKQFSDEINKIKCCSQKVKNQNIKFNSDWVRDECNEYKSTRALKEAAEQLLHLQIDDAPIGGWRSKERFDIWLKDAPLNFKDAALRAGNYFTDGLYVDDTGYAGLKRLSEPHFLQAIQGIYTTEPDPPKAVKGGIYRGFWRIALWKEENAIVEFGFPGPRVKRFSEKEFNQLIKSVKIGSLNEPEFHVNYEKVLSIIDQLIELGYLVPDTL